MASIASPVSSEQTRPLLHLDGVDSGYGKTTILRGVTLEVPPGMVVGVLGANGAGKSTLLRTISGEISPTAGTLSYDGGDLAKTSAVNRALQGIAHIPEGRGIFRSLTVKENLTLFARRGEGTGAVQEVLEAFPILGQRLGQRAGALSGGEQQMLAMASAYCRKVKLVLVDEPSLGLAPKITDQVFSFLGGLAARGVSLIVVDQFVDKILEIATFVYILQRGSVVFSGATETLGPDVFGYYLGSGAGTQPAAD